MYSVFLTRSHGAFTFLKTSLTVFWSWCSSSFQIAFTRSQILARALTVEDLAGKVEDRVNS